MWQGINVKDLALASSYNFLERRLHILANMDTRIVTIEASMVIGAPKLE